MIMRSLSVAVLALCFGLTGTANAQLPSKLKEEAEKALKKQLGDERQETGRQQPGDQSRSRPPVRTDASRAYPPGLSFSTVLNGVVLLPKDGKFCLQHLQATFIPDGCEGGFVVLRTADGTELYQFDWMPDHLKKPYTLLNFHKTTDLQSGATSGGATWAKLAPGDYVLDFYLPDEQFYTYPFSVRAIGNDEPFGEGQCFVMDGDWRDWGYLLYTDANPDQNLEWKIWLRNDACGEKDVTIQVEITRDADGDLVCTSRPNTTHSVQPKWERYALDMVFPEGKEVPQGTYFKARDLLEKDGAYTLTMKIDGEAYGTWKFRIEGGKLKYAGRTLRGDADPLTFIEGGRDAWWYAKE
jgi:hypothetical protein